MVVFIFDFREKLKLLREVFMDLIFFLIATQL